jgi:hypothetical protein
VTTQNTENFKSIRPDFSVFLYPERLCQHCGVGPERIRRLVAKELVDNALDVAGNCEIGLLEDGRIVVSDNGPGIPVADLGRIFAVGRPMETTKLERTPTRGALGNGLRVVTGAVLASEGSITVWSDNHFSTVTPQRDGSDAKVESRPEPCSGTTIAVDIGSAFPADPDVLSWGRMARSLAANGSTDYKGKPSPWWYSVDAYHELCQSAQEVSVREILSRFEGCSGAKAGQIADGFQGRTVGSLTKDEIAELLTKARTHGKQVKPDRLGFVGELDSWSTYAKTTGTGELSSNGDIPALIPFVVEAWAKPMEGKDHAQIFVNRTPIVNEPHTWKTKSVFTVYGDGVHFEPKIGTNPLSFWVNLQAPYVPLLSNSKAPDLRAFATTITEVMEKAARKVQRLAPSITSSSKKAENQNKVIIDVLPEAINKASGNGQYRYSVRQLYYTVRPYVADRLGKALTYKWFGDVIKDHESEIGADLPGIYRDTRGTLYHPHLNESIPVGTLSVEGYRRPAWTFNKILYSEKEGFFEILKSVQWPERHDCALLTSKGYASRAARDLLDFLGDSGEDLVFFCIHDADGDGTMIYQTLMEATTARAGRRVHVVNLGLEPEDALAMGLEVETFQSKKAVPVADYVPNSWKVWLQTHRVELNAMTSPQFLAWLDRKFVQAVGKIIPPGDVIMQHQEQVARATLRTTIAERILREAGIDDHVEAALAELLPQLPTGLDAYEMIDAAFRDDPAQQWRGPVERRIREMVRATHE